jgi:hypothetical protein
MSVYDFYFKNFLSLLWTQEPDSRDRVFLFCQKLPSGMKKADLYQSPESAAAAYQAARLYEFAHGQSASTPSVSAFPSPSTQLSLSRNSRNCAPSSMP